MERKKRDRLDKYSALSLMQKYCAYQERCHSEVRTRLLEHQVYGDDLEEIISELITENYLNEERFARSFARGKFRIKKWGKIKITKELKFRKVSDYCIRKAMTEIDTDEYEETLIRLLKKKNSTTKASNDFDRRKKLTSYAQQKGYEYDVIRICLTEIL